MDNTTDVINQDRNLDIKLDKGMSIDIAGYYKDEIQSDTLKQSRSQIKKLFSKKEPDMPSGQPAPEKKGFRILAKKDRQDIPDAFGQIPPSATNISQPQNPNLVNANSELASICISGLDMLSDKVTSWLTDSKFTDSKDLQDKRKELTKAFTSLLNKWGVHFTEEMNMVILLGAYASAKSRHLVKKTDLKVVKKDEPDSKIFNLSEAVKDKEEKLHRRGMAGL